ncbi:hypothetical protein [Paracoccus aestuariivivens]|uniref:Uncharacterized protein n=1 Tax=Paracoccus aestuariivivens TaxID=1820333 RepID=A0A6L6JBQ0_9RHOB|nr:hypothetical protein [Paracoccus aestuariivivens]MTH79410.1 hypothetical protein [Paracoccus aestuariivivens]
MDSIISGAMPGLLEALSVVLTGLIGWLAAAAKKKWGIEIEARQREALHWALHTGAELALKQQLTGKAAIDLVVAYAMRSVPDAIKGLAPSSDVLTDLAKVKLEQVASDKLEGLVGAGVDKLTEALARATAAAVC